MKAEAHDGGDGFIFQIWTSVLEEGGRVLVWGVWNEEEVFYTKGCRWSIVLRSGGGFYRTPTRELISTQI